MLNFGTDCDSGYGAQCTKCDASRCLECTPGDQYHLFPNRTACFGKYTLSLINSIQFKPDTVVSLKLDRDGNSYIKPKKCHLDITVHTHILSRGADFPPSFTPTYVPYYGNGRMIMFAIVVEFGLEQ